MLLNAVPFDVKMNTGEKNLTFACAVLSEIVNWTLQQNGTGPSGPSGQIPDCWLLNGWTRALSPDSSEYCAHGDAVR